MPKQPLKVDNYDPFVEILSQGNTKIVVSLRDVLLCLVREFPLLGFDVNDCPDKLQKEFAIILTRKLIIKEVDLMKAIQSIPDNIVEELSKSLTDLEMTIIANKPESLKWFLENLELVETVLETVIEFAATNTSSPTKKKFFMGVLKELPTINLTQFKHILAEEFKTALQEKTIAIDMSQ